MHRGLTGRETPSGNLAAEKSLRLDMSALGLGH